MPKNQEKVSLSQRGQEIIKAHKEAKTLLQTESTFILGHLLMNYCDNPKIDPIADQFPIVTLTYKIEELSNSCDDSNSQELKETFEELKSYISKLNTALEEKGIKLNNY